MSELSLGSAFRLNFLGTAPKWYKNMIIGFLILNPVLFYTVGPFVAGWCLIMEFIATLALSLKCYPLPSGGLLAIEAVIIGMTTPLKVYNEVTHNISVILLLIFMVAGIYFMKEFLLFIFSRLLVGIKSKIALSFIFCFMGAFLSAFLDALTVTAVIIAVAYGFYGIYHRYASSGDFSVNDDSGIKDEYRKDLDQFRGFLRNLMMHAAVGTALGGALTLVGEPQNLLIGSIMNWDFPTFFKKCSEISIPVLCVGLLTCLIVEITGILGYGYKIPDRVSKVLEDDVARSKVNMDERTIARFVVKGAVAVLLIFALAFHLAEVGLIGLGVIILISSFTGVTEEHDFGKAFVETMPFTSLLVVFFTIVAVIGSLELFKPLTSYVLSLSGKEQLVSFFAANGILSAISDNVFVATVYINEAKSAFEAGIINLEQFEKLAVATNMGTNIPSVATPNGQAAFLFLLTSALAPVIRLSYVEMLKLALPYTVTMTATGLLATYFFL